MGGVLQKRHDWHRRDRCFYRVTGQRGIVEGWKGNMLLVYWGFNSNQAFRDWVPEADCDWEPQPVEVVG